MTYGNTNSRSSEVKSAPFRAVIDFRKRELVLAANLPSLKALLLLLALSKVHDVILPGDRTPSITTHPATVQVQVDVDIVITSDMDRHVGCRDRLAQSRGRRDGGQEGNGNLRDRGRRIQEVGEIGRGGIIIHTEISRELNF